MIELLEKMTAFILAELQGPSEEDKNTLLTQKAVIVGNDVVDRLRTLTGPDIKDLVRSHSTALVVRLYRHLETGEAQQNARNHVSAAIASNPCLQRCIVGRGTYLTDEAILQLAPPSLLNACREVLDLVQCTYGDDWFADSFLAELSNFIEESR